MIGDVESVWAIYKEGYCFLVMRCIANNADDEATMSYENFSKMAANDSSEILVEMLKMRPYNPDQ